MIKYKLSCKNCDLSFDSWFASSKEFEKLCESDKIRQSLIDSTNDGIKRGVFGVPSIFVGSEMFWGKDRMEFVEDELIKN